MHTWGGVGGAFKHCQKHTGLRELSAFAIETSKSKQDRIMFDQTICYQAFNHWALSDNILLELLLVVVFFCSSGSCAFGSSVVVGGGSVTVVVDIGGGSGIVVFGVSVAVVVGGGKDGGDSGANVHILGKKGSREGVTSAISSL